MSVRKVFILLAAAAGVSAAVAAGGSTFVGGEIGFVDQPLQPDAGAGAPHMQMSCARPMARHDHRAEKGTPTPMASGCAQAAPNAAAAKAKASRGHNHAKAHKLM